MVREWAQEKDRALGLGLVQESVEEKARAWAPALGPDLGQAWVQELSTPARAWLLLWNCLLPW